MTRTSGSASALLDGLVELLQQLLADGILLVRAVEPDAGDVTLDLVLDRLDLDSDRHAQPPFLELKLL